MEARGVTPNDHYAQMLMADTSAISNSGLYGPNV